MPYKITGTVLTVETTQTFPTRNGGEFSRRELVIARHIFDPFTGEPTVSDFDTPSFTFVQNRCPQLDLIEPGQVVTVSFDVCGRSWEKEGRKGVINELRGISVVSKPGTGTPQPVPAPAQTPPPAAVPPVTYTAPASYSPQTQAPQFNDDLPF